MKASEASAKPRRRREDSREPPAPKVVVQGKETGPKEPVYYVRHLEVIEECRRVFSEHPRILRVVVRCAQGTPIVADRSNRRAVTLGEVHFLAGPYCDLLHSAPGTYNRRPIEEQATADRPPIWMRWGRHLDRWRRRKFSHEVNLIVDDSIAVAVQCLGPMLAAVWGAEMVSMAVTQKRLMICRRCDQYHHGICKACGCVTKFKARLSGEGHLGCPLGKW